MKSMGNDHRNRLGSCQSEHSTGWNIRWTVWPCLESLQALKRNNITYIKHLLGIKLYKSFSVTDLDIILENICISLPSFKQVNTYKFTCSSVQISFLKIFRVDVPMVTTPSMSFSELLVTGYKTKYVVNIVTHFIPKWENLYFSEQLLILCG